MRLNIISRGSGAVAVASDTRGPWFESSHQQDFIMNINAVNFIEKTKMKKQRPGMAQFFNISSRRDVNKMILQKMYKGSFTISSKNWVQFQLEQKWWCGKHERERGEKFIIIWRKSPPWLLSPFWTTTTPSFRVKFETHLSFRETAMPPLLKILKQLLRLLYQKCLSIARNMDPSWMNQKSFVE